MKLALFAAVVCAVVLEGCGSGVGSLAPHGHGAGVARRPMAIGSVSEVSTGSTYSPGMMALGNAGQVWFTPFQGSGNSSPNIGRIDQSNSVTFFNTTTTLYDRNGIVVASDGNTWFSDQFHDQVGFVSASGSATLFHLSTGSRPIGLAAGSDGAIWIAENGVGKIGRITTQGTYGEYGSGLSDVRSVAAGQDGNVWFTEHGNAKIGKVTPAGVVTEYAVPSGGAPAMIRPGPDGNMWFTEYESNRIGYGTPSGTITEYNVRGGPNGLVAGPDGNIWFAEFSGNAIGVITTGGAWIAEVKPRTSNSQPYDLVATSSAVYFSERMGTAIGIIPVTAEYVGAITEIPTGSGYSAGFIALGDAGKVWFTPFQGSGYSSPNVGWLDQSNVVNFVNTTTTLFDRNGIVLGPDGNQWFSDQVHDQVGFVRPSGTVSLFHLSAGSHPIGLAVGADAAIWIAENGTGKIGRITVQGGYSEYGSGLSDVRTVARGADGNVWFTEHGNAKLGKITISGTITEYAIPSGGAPAVAKPGPDGNMWFTEYESNRIGYSTPGGAITEFPVQGGPNGLTTGPDGNIWYAEFAGNGIGAISRNGTPIAQYATPTTNSQPYDIVGTCNKIYFTERMGTAIGMFPLVRSGSGQYTEVSTGSGYSAGFIALGDAGKVWFTPFQGTGNSSPNVGWLDQSNIVNFVNTTTTLFDRNGIVLGPDGNQWFSDQLHDQVGFVTPSGTVSLFHLSAGSHPIGLTVGTDAAIWIAENGAGKIGRISVQGTYSEYGSGLSDVRTVASQVPSLL